MSLWEFVGLTWLLNKLFGGSKRTSNETHAQSYDHVSEAVLDDRFDTLTERIDASASRQDEIGSNSVMYDDVDSLRDELDEIEYEQEIFDDD